MRVRVRVSVRVRASRTAGPPPRRCPPRPFRPAGSQEAPPHRLHACMYACMYECMFAYMDTLCIACCTYARCKLLLIAALGRRVRDDGGGEGQLGGGFRYGLGRGFVRGCGLLGSCRRGGEWVGRWVRRGYGCGGLGSINHGDLDARDGVLRCEGEVLSIDGSAPACDGTTASFAAVSPHVLLYEWRMA